MLCRVTKSDASLVLRFLGQGPVSLQGCQFRNILKMWYWADPHIIIKWEMAERGRQKQKS